MAIVDPIVLPPDVVLLPVEELPDEVRGEFAHEPGDYALTRPRSRMPTSIVDVRTAGLLEAFRAPKTIVDAVISYSRAEQLDPRETLEAAFPVLQQFLNAGVLLPAESDLARPIETSFVDGETLGDFEVVRPVHVLVDTEVYLARSSDGTFAAVKVARPGSAGRLRTALAREAAVLQVLDGRVNPQVLQLGDVDGRPFLALSWCRGIDAHEAASEVRRRGAEGRAELLELAAGVVEAYAHLHSQGVLHGDVHPRNVLVDESGNVKLVDFGLAGVIGEEPLSGPWRGGIDFFLEPEFAAARLEGKPPPALSARGEQYSVAALVYLLLTGGHTNAFSLEEDEMLRQLASEPPAPFSEHNAVGLARTEEVLRRALEKRPPARFGSVDEFAEAVREAARSDRSAAAPPRRTRTPKETEVLLEDVLSRLSGSLLSEPLESPTASVWSGAGGFAYAVLRIAYCRDDERLLALSDLWASKALEGGTSSAGFWNDDLGITREEFGETSLYHSAVGVHCVDALIANARGDAGATEAALEAFFASSAADRSKLDLAFGRAGLLLGCSFLLESLALDSSDKEARLRALGAELAQSVWDELAVQPPLADRAAQATLGVAHGWSGFLYALLRWSEVTGEPPETGLAARLRELGALAVPAGRGLFWPRHVGASSADEGLGASWCNGAAGFVYLWLLAARLLGDEGYRRLAEQAAWTAFEDPPVGGDLCCGLAGRAYSLLALWRHGGGNAWLARARMLADSAAGAIRSHALRRDSLYKGEIGVALLAAELERPDQARMPLFEADELRLGA